MHDMGEPPKADENDCKVFETHLNFGDKRNKKAGTYGDFPNGIPKNFVVFPN